MRNQITILVVAFLLFAGARLFLRQADVHVEPFAYATPSPSPFASRYFQFSCSNSDPCTSGNNCYWVKCSDGLPYFHKGADDSTVPLASQ